MKNQIILFLVLIFLQTTASAQWTQKEIVPLSFRDSVLPVWADINNDGLSDLVGYDNDLETLFYRVMGPSGFSNNVTIETVALRDGHFLATDWDNDGDMDILIELASSFGYSIQARIYLNDGAGNFSSEEFSLEVLQYTGKIVDVADMDGDGFSELLVEQSDDHYLYDNNGTDYTYVPANVGTTNSLGKDVSFHDLDQDGLSEVVDAKQQEIIIYSYDGNELVEIQTIPTPGITQGNAPIYEYLRVHDLDGDGDLDLCRKVQDANLETSGDVGNVIPSLARFYEYVQGDNGMFSVNLFYESTTNAFHDETPYRLAGTNTFAYAIYGEDLRIFEFENGGFVEKEVYPETFPTALPEIVASISISESLDGQPYSFKFSDNQYELALATLTAVPEQKFSWSTCTNCALSLNYDELILTDLDGDDDEDILIASAYNSSELLWLQNHKRGCNFDTMHMVLTDYFDADDTVLNVAAGDLDNDGYNDLALLVNNEDNVLYVLSNDGKGSFSEPTEIPLDFDFGFELYIEDLYEDGYAEIIIHAGQFSFTSQDLTTFSVSILNNTTGIENYQLDRLQTMTSRGQVEFGDIDNDDDLDLVIYNDDPFNETVVLYENDNGAVTEKQQFADFPDMYGMDLFDYDDDGFLDVLAFHDDLASFTFSSLYFYKNNNGLMDFDSPVLLYQDIERGPAVAIRNEDGGLDLIGSTLNAFNSNLVSYDETGSRDTLDHRVQVDFLVGDITGDGFDDILSGNFNGGLSFYTRDEVDCNEIECSFGNTGKVITMECDGITKLLIELESGGLLDPNFDMQNDFELENGQLIKFDYIDFNGGTDCIDAIPVLISCIEKTGTSSVEDSDRSSLVFNAYPTPVSETLFIDMEDSEGNLALYDFSGRLIKLYPQNTSQIDVSFLNEGSYFITLTSKGTAISQRIIKL